MQWDTLFPSPAVPNYIVTVLCVCYYLYMSQGFRKERTAWVPQCYPENINMRLVFSYVSFLDSDEAMKEFDTRRIR